MIGVRSVLVALLAASPVLAADPALTVTVERVDTGRFPEVDLWFRVVDPTGGDHHPLGEPDVQIRLEDLPEGRTAASAVTRVSDNFKDPLRRPLALAFAVDRASGVEPVLSKVGQALEDLATVMEAESRSDDPDLMAVAVFGGMFGLRSVQRLDFTPTAQQVQDFTRIHCRTAPAGTPFYQATQLAIDEAAAFATPAGSISRAMRAVVILSDGVQSPAADRRSVSPRAGGRKAQALLLAKRARAMDVPVFTLGIPRAKASPRSGKFTTGDLYRPALRALAEGTGGTFDELVSPIPRLPDLPAVDPSQAADPGGMPAQDAREYLLEMFETLKGEVARQGLDGALPDGLRAVAAAVLDPDPASYANLIEALGASPPALAGLDQLTWNQLSRAHAELEDLRGVALDGLDLDSSYRAWVLARLKKLRLSLKTLYRVTYRTPDTQHDGSLHRVSLAVRYVTKVDGADREIEGVAGAGYHAPRIVPEDTEHDVALELTGDDPRVQAMIALEDPRGIAWEGPPRLITRRELWMDVEDGSGAGSGAVVVAVREDSQDPPVTVLVPPVPEEARDPRAAFDEAKRNEMVTFLEGASIALESPDITQVAVRARFPTPTALSKTAEPAARPVPARVDPDGRRLMWYHLAGELVRDFSYDAVVPDPASTDEMTFPPVTRRLTGSVRRPIPSMSYFVTDVTPPSLVVHLEAESGAVGTFEVIETPVDAPAGPTGNVAFRISGGGFTPGKPELTRVALRERPTGGPLELPDGEESAGFYIGENERLLIRLVARDNFHLAVDHGYLVTPPVAGEPPLPVSNRFNEEDMSRTEARTGEPPFLPRRDFCQIGQAAGERFEAGVGWRIREADTVLEEQPDSIVLRRANVPEGDPVYLEIRASDEAGRATDPGCLAAGAQPIKIPLRVVPMGVDITKLNETTQKDTKPEGP